MKPTPDEFSEVNPTETPLNVLHSKVNPTGASLHDSHSGKKTAAEEFSKVNPTCSPLDFSESEPSSKEEEGSVPKHTHSPLCLVEEAPTQNDGRLYLFLDFEGRNPPTVTHQTHRVTVRDGKPRFFDSPELARARADICARLERSAPDAPFEGPLALSVSWLFRDARGRRGWRDTKPDTDNLQKLLKDCMTRTRFWIDDAQVAWETVSKLWAATPGISISIVCLEPGRLVF